MRGVLKRRSLGNRLALLTVAFCLLFSAATAGLRTWNIWEQNRLGMDTELQLLEQVYQSTLTKAIWELDKPAVQAQLDGASRIASVGRIELRLTGHGQESDVQSRQQADWAPSSLAPSRSSTLVYSPIRAVTRCSANSSSKAMKPCSGVNCATAWRVPC